MCYSNTITWMKCGHYVIRRQYCEEALGRQPLTFCRTPHTPIFTDVAKTYGVCPDRKKHPPAAGQSSISAWSDITTTSGEGNDWYRGDNELHKKRPTPHASGQRALVSDQLIENLIDLLFPNTGLALLCASAYESRFPSTENLQQIIGNYGSNLKIEASTEIEKVAGRFLGSGSTAALLAYAITKRLGIVGSDAKSRVFPRDEPDEVHAHKENDLYDYTDDDVSQMEQYLPNLTDFMLQSASYEIFNLQRLELMNRPYQRQIYDVLEGSVIYERQERLEPAAISAIATELSWIPPGLFTVTVKCLPSWSDSLKAWVEDMMEERWDWWPLAPRRLPIPAGCERLAWTSPQGTTGHIDVAPRRLSRLIDVFAKAPKFLNEYVPARRTQQMTGRPDEPVKRGSAVDSSGANSQQNDQGNANNTQISHTSTPGGPPSSANQTMLYFSVQSGDRFDIVELKENNMRTDREFFAALKKEYKRLKRQRRWISMWNYDHCDFALFSKYACDTCAFVKVDYPPPSDFNYDYAPRPIVPPPPYGPITKYEFRDRFYRCCDECHSWHWHRRKLLRFKLADRDAVDRLPKRRTALDLADGKREQFWGLLARERRSFARVLAMCLLWNVFSAIFFFLWIFRWNHPADLQNAIVPMTVTLAITGLYVCMIYEDREGNK